MWETCPNRRRERAVGFFQLGKNLTFSPSLYAGVPKKSLNPILNSDLIGDNLVSDKVSSSEHQISE